MERFNTLFGRLATIALCVWIIMSALIRIVDEFADGADRLAVVMAIGLHGWMAVLICMSVFRDRWDRW